MYKLCFLLVALFAKDCTSQEDDEGPYRGKLIGKLNSYHHQVSGDVYAVDDWTILLVDFNYDGTGDDTFFWAGDSGRPGPQGFIIPDQNGKTNILERYYNEEVRISLPEGKRLSRLKWLAVYDIGSQNTFGDVYVPEEFEPPAPRTIPALTGKGVSSQPLQLLDASTILIPEFRYDGSGSEVYFWTGVGPQPSAKGILIPDEYGYLEPLRPYSGSDVKLVLPGGRSLRDVQWLAIWDRAAGRALASVLLPPAAVPPVATSLHPYTSSLPNCKQLHRDYQVSWEVFGPQITIQLAAKISETAYMAFGISGDTESSRMLGADVAIARFEPALQQGKATDYNISAIAPCVQVLGQWQGVCSDERLNGQDNNQVFSASRDQGITVVTYRRSLQPAEPMDREWSTSVPVAVVWALGQLDTDYEPSFHYAFPRTDLTLNLTAPAHSDCEPFTIGSSPPVKGWERAELFDPALRVFTFTLGPAGGARGLAARGVGGEPAPAPALAWYVNGQLAPDIQLRRGLHYTFKVLGGNDPHSAAEYHPLLVTTEPRGGVETLSPPPRLRALAGAALTRRGRMSPTAAGPLCIGREGAGADIRRAADFASFRTFNRTLQWSCAAEPPAELAISANSSWPDLVYYHSFTHRHMGGRIFIVDRHKRNLGRAPSHAAHLTASLAVTLSVLALLTTLVARH